MNTINILTELYHLFDALNERYFENSLPKVFITIKQGKTKSKAVYGTFCPESWAKQEKEVDENGNTLERDIETINEIAISGEYQTRPLNQLASTMQHEMVHLFCSINEIQDTSNNGVYHNKRFKRECETRDLIIDKADIIGYSITSPTDAFTAFVEAIGIDTTPFTYYRNTRLVEGNKAPKKRFVCPLCGMQVQAKKKANIVCGDCGKRMDYWDLTEEGNEECIEDYNDGLYNDGWFGMEEGAE